ncbi:MAG: sodium:solute symporter family transporter [Planctomycetota bacterium]|jgi:Na+/proline symporter
MSSVDYGIILLYFGIVIGLGCWYKKRASRNLESYFLAGKNMHWLALAMSGSVATFDITGTMWIVTLLTLFGMKSMWNHWMWGFLMAAFFMSYMGKWVRRSGVMTGAEWMVTRFGDSVDGKTARISYTIMAVVMLTGFIGYAFQGIGKFLSVYITFGLPPETAATVGAIIVFSVTTLYVLLGGLYSVVVTNVIQTVILTVASIVIACVAYFHVSPSMLEKVLPADWTSLAPAWRLENAAQLPEAYTGYELFGALVIIWVLKGLLLNLGGPGQMTDFQAFLAARDARDACKLGAAWSGFLVVRWAMCMGIALLAVTGLAESGDPEKVMPMVLQEYLPIGMRGLVIAGLLAAFMSTFSATVNAAASYIVRDLWQPLVRQTDQRSLVKASYVATAAVVLTGTAIGFLSDSIRQIWDWLMIALGAAFVVPNVLRWYWWRLNGWGYSSGTLAGLAGAVPILFWTLAGKSEPPLYITFPALCGVSLVATLVGTWLTRPTDEKVLVTFCQTVRPFGLWGPIRTRCQLPENKQNDPPERPTMALVNLILSSIVILGCYLGPMYLVGHWHTEAAVLLAIAGVGSVLLYCTWYRFLPEPGDGAD